MLRTTPMKRSPMKSSRKPMRKRSKKFKRATAAEIEHMEKVKAAGCLACWLNYMREKWCNLQEAVSMKRMPKRDAHHLKDGNRRRGHLFTLGMCKWHHQAYKPEGYEWVSLETVVMCFGPTIEKHARQFREHYGSDDSLLEMQAELLRLLEVQ